MPAGSILLYSANKDDMRLQDLAGATIKMMLVASGYVPDDSVTGHAVLADITNEIANGNGYLTGGVALSSIVIAQITAGWKFSSGNAVWNATPGNFPAWRRGVLYISGNLWGKTNPLLGHFLGDAAPADVPATLAGNPCTVYCPPGGWFDIA